MHESFFLTDWLYQAMRWLYSIISAPGTLQTGYAVFVTIVIATIALKGLTVFSDINMRKHSMKTQALQPQIEKIKEKYGSDPRRVQQEQGKLMKDNGVSMLGGCLPMLIMLPLFFMFVAAFRVWANERMLHLMLTMQNNPEAGVELFKSYSFLWIHNIWQPDNFFKLGCFGSSVTPVPSASEFWTTFSALKFDKLRLDADYIAMLQNLHFFEPGTTTIVADNTQFLAAYDTLMANCVSVWEGYANGYAILPLIAGGTSLLSSWLSQKAQPKPMEGQQSQNKMMIYAMPLFFSLFCLGYSAAFALYWITSNIVSLIVTLILNRIFLKKRQENQLEVIK